ncbi:hypothetical protein FQR65_LT09154 [Abscondita terminalis]|nr:hypothetical protein FQR65_LT09154 [Abscondita terminalis]
MKRTQVIRQQQQQQQLVTGRRDDTKLILVPPHEVTESDIHSDNPYVLKDENLLTQSDEADNYSHSEDDDFLDETLFTHLF